jgi:protein LTV1
VIDDEGEVFGGDGYDYTQHLRPLGTAGGIFVPAPEFPEDMGHYKQKREKKKRLPKDFPQEVLPNEPDISRLGKDVDLSFLDQLTEEQKRRYFYQMLPGGIDLEVLDALEHPENYEDNGELEDDFIAKANAVMLSDEEMSDADEDSEMIEDEIDDDITDHVTRVTSKLPREESQTAKAAPTLLDEMFEATLAKYDKDMELASDEEDIDAQGTVEIGAYEQVLDEFLADRKRPAHELLVPAPESKIRVAQSTKRYIEDDEDSLEGAEEQMAELYLKEGPKAQFDCESIISTYSNLENHPVLISDEPTNRIKLSKKGIPVGVLRKKVAEEEEEEEAPKQNLGVAREKEEDKEAKKQRKQLVKQERRMRREDKKSMKEAYKAEEMKQKQHLATNKVQNKSVIHL